MNRNLAMASVGFLTLAGSAAAALPPSGPIQGPTLLCLKYSTFYLEDGERVIDFSATPEGMSITIRGQAGTFEIGESEIWAEPKRKGRAVRERDGTAVHRERGGHYGIYGRPSYSPQEAQLVIRLSGDALRDSITDRSIYNRFEVRDPEGAVCGHGFTYGWDFVE